MIYSIVKVLIKDNVVNRYGIFLIIVWFNVCSDDNLDVCVKCKLMLLVLMINVMIL